MALRPVMPRSIFLFLCFRVSLEDSFARAHDCQDSDRCASEAASGTPDAIAHRHHTLFGGQLRAVWVLRWTNAAQDNFTYFRDEVR